MKVYIKGLIFGCMLIAAVSHAQTGEPINSGQIIADGIKLHNQEKYKEAIELYRKVPRNDTNYAFANYEIAYSQYADKALDEAILSIRKGLALDDDTYELDLLILLGSAIDDKGDVEHAIRLYDSALVKFPNSQALSLNKGITLIRLQRTDEAEAIIKNLLLKNPYYASAHFRLGQCAIQRGQLVQSMMCFFSYLINSPDGAHSNTIIKLLGNMSKGTDDVMEVVNKRTERPMGNFAMVEQIILSKIALDKNYKVMTDLDDPIIRQLQVMMEKLEFDSDNPDFYMQYYVPYLKDIFNKDQFEPAVFRAFSNVQIETIQKYMKKNTKKLAEAVSVISENFSWIRATRELNYEKRLKMDPIYHYDNGVFFAKGKLENEKTSGKWEFYFANGNLKSHGEYRNGNKHGKWTYYFSNGKVSGYDNWVNGVQEGEDLIYNKRGVLTYKSNFKNGKLEGDKTSYYALGHVYSITPYKAGVESGKYLQYYTSGRKQIEAGIVDNNLEGAYLSFHKNGKQNIVTNYSKGQVEGSYKSYYDNGQLEFEANYKAGEPVGEHLTYHRNGKIKRKARFSEGELEGEELEYNDEGTLIQKVIYKKGKAEGLAEYFGSDGKLFSTFLFDNNKLKVAKYFDKSGKEIDNANRQQKQIEMDKYNSDGFKVTTVTYDDDANKQGKETFYYNSGQVKEINFYKDGMLNGLTTGYFPNGSKQYEVNYVNDEKHGFVKNFFLNGKLSSQGWYVEGKLNGDWIEYNEKGDLVSITTYLNDDIYGIKQSFIPGGKLADEEYYLSGWFNGLQQYDTSGNLLHLTQLVNGTGKYQGIHYNKKPRWDGEYISGDPHGPFKVYFFDGSLNVSKKYDRGLLVGEYVDYYYGGQVYSRGQYDLGERTGNWKFYAADGKLLREENYVDGMLNGKYTSYFPDGKTERELIYKNGDRHGSYKRYSQDGQLVFEFKYEYDVAVAYSYLDKNNKMVPFISIRGGNGKVKTYFSNGNVSSEMQFLDGVLSGPYKIYHSNGKMYYEEEDLICGITHGKLTEYYSNGQPKLVYNYYYNNQDGHFTEYYEDGKLKEEGDFYNGTIVGPQKFYNTSGKLVETRTYFNGTLINVSK